MIAHGSQPASRICHAGHDAALVLNSGQALFWNYTLQESTLPPLQYRMVYDSTGMWIETGWMVDDELSLTGNSTSGWTDGNGFFRFDLMTTVDLATWESGMMGDCQGQPEDNGDGSHTWWARSSVPVYWSETMVDLTATSDRYGKSLIDSTLMGSAVSISGYPYAMPADCARLQSDLRAAGYPGATVTSIPGSLTATAVNHISDGPRMLNVIQSGSDVTSVSFHGSTISLPGYPYSMPGQRAILQSALRTAGYSGAVVRLHADTWSIFIPDLLATDKIRDFQIEFTPADPFKYWDGFGTYQGELPDNAVTGTSGNVRDPTGAPLRESPTQFVRLKITQLKS